MLEISCFREWDSWQMNTCNECVFLYVYVFTHFNTGIVVCAVFIPFNE